LFGLDIQLLSSEKENYLLLSPDLTKDFNGVLKLNESSSLLALAAEEVLDNSGLKFDLTTITTYSVTNTLTKERVNDRLQRHYEISRNIDDNSISSLGRLLSENGFSQEIVYRNDGEVKAISGDAWVDDNSGKLTKLIYTVQLEAAAYKVEVVPIQSVDFGELEARLAEAQTPEVFVGLSDLDLISALAKLKLTSFAQQYSELNTWANLLVIEENVKQFAQVNFYYPTLVQLKEFLLQKQVAGQEGVDFERLAGQLDSKINYTTTELDCTNQADDYCSGFQLSIDSVRDGQAEKDADGDTIDFFRP
jgi:hypothetical protein